MGIKDTATEADLGNLEGNYREDLDWGEVLVIS